VVSTSSQAWNTSVSHHRDELALGASVMTTQGGRQARWRPVLELHVEIAYDANPIAQPAKIVVEHAPSAERQPHPEASDRDPHLVRAFGIDTGMGNRDVHLQVAKPGVDPDSLLRLALIRLDTPRPVLPRVAPKHRRWTMHALCTPRKVNDVAAMSHWRGVFDERGTENGARWVNLASAPSTSARTRSGFVSWRGPTVTMPSVR
jgi:hypothetical protein